MREGPGRIGNLGLRSAGADAQEPCQVYSTSLCGPGRGLPPTRAGPRAMGRGSAAEVVWGNARPRGMAEQGMEDT